MQDGIGTTTYTYNSILATPTLGSGMLGSISGPLPNSTVSFQYDALTRATNRVINGYASTVTLDQLGRTVKETNILGPF